MKFKSHLVTQVSGSVAGTTYAHNRGGLYQRARSIPVNSRTPARTAIRNAFTTLVQRWTNVLTDAQRSAWAIYAANVPVLNVFGDAVTLTGQQMYIRNNAPRLVAAFLPVDDGPTIFTNANLPTCSLTVTTGAPLSSVLEIDYTGTGGWENELGGCLLVQAGLPQVASVNYYNSPFQFLASVAGVVLTPAAPPFDFNPPYGIVAGQKVWTRVRASMADGRLSLPQTLFGVA